MNSYRTNIQPLIAYVHVRICAHTKHTCTLRVPQYLIRYTKETRSHDEIGIGRNMDGIKQGFNLKIEKSHAHKQHARVTDRCELVVRSRTC